MAISPTDPKSGSRARVARKALPAGLLAAVAIAIVAVLVFGLGAHPGGPAASGGSSASPSAGSLANASGNPSACVSPNSSTGLGTCASPSSALPSPTHSATATPVSETKAAVVVTHVPNCSQDYGWSHAVSGNYLFVMCGDTRGDGYVARLDLATNKVVAKYPTDLESVYSLAVVGGSLWYDGQIASGCTPSNCQGMQRIERVNTATKKNAKEMLDWSLVGYGLGYIWASNKTGQVSKLDPATGAVKGTIPFKYDRISFDCGSLWGLSSDPTSSDGPTTLARLDPTNGSVLAKFSEPGRIGALQQIGTECWAPAIADAGATAPTDAPVYDHFVRIGQSSIEFRSPKIPSGQNSVAIFAGTFWVLSGLQTRAAGASPAPAAKMTMQRLDPATWQPAGTIWTYGGLRPEFAAGGSIWASNAAGTQLNRLNITLGPIGS